MPGEDGISLLKDWQSNGSLQCPVVMMSGHGTVETAVEATRLGAYDFIEKPLTMAKLLVSVKRALEASDFNQEESGKDLFIEAPVGNSLPIQSLRDQAKKTSAHDNVVFISGEAGVGKKSYANYIHSLSARKNKRFTFLNEDNFNSAQSAQQLLGYEEKEIVTPGILESCKSGTIYISDVAKINSQGQRLLTQLLKKKQYRRVGGKAVLNFDSRIIVATQADLKAEVKAEHFDDELYFLLNVVAIKIPALREHLQDVPELLRFYMSSEDEISAEEVGVALEEQLITSNEDASSTEQLFNLPLREARESFERSYFLFQLKQVGGNISKLSERVGLERTHLYRKLRALGINTKESQ